MFEIYYKWFLICTLVYYDIWGNIERMSEIIQLPFWQNVLDGLRLLFKSAVCKELSLVSSTPLWYNNILRLPIKPNWLRMGITTISDVLNDRCQFFSLEEFQSRYNLNTNFLEYGGFVLTLKLFLDNSEKPSINVTRPQNCLLNTILCRDLKGVSLLYKTLISKRGDILQNICQKCYNKGDIILDPYEVKNSLLKTNRMIDDVHLKYTQFRTLHYRYYTNDVLVKCRIKESDNCSICGIDKDSNHHMLIACDRVQGLWSNVEAWIRSLGMINYHLTDRKKILGDLENTLQINIIILITKKTIYQAKLDCKTPTLLQVQLNLRQVFNHEYYNSIIKDKKHLFEKKWSSLLDFFNYIST